MLDKLVALDGQLVTVVRPFFGTQSDSFRGEFHVTTIADSFHLCSDGHSMIFTVDDVKSVVENVVRLKGPRDYNDA